MLQNIGAHQHQGQSQSPLPTRLQPPSQSPSPSRLRNSQAVASIFKINTAFASVFLVVCLVALALVLVGCGSNETSSSLSEQSSGAHASHDSTHLTIASLKGPTSIGLAALMQEDSEAYTFDIEGAADAIVPKIVQGTVDIALIPANLAATLYQKTNGGVRVIDINTLGVLYGVSQSDAFSDISSLKGATVYMTGKGTVPQYTLDALLAAAGLTEADLTIEFKSEPAEVVAAITADAQAIGILPQPYVTAATAKNAALKVCLDLTAQWETLMGGDAGKLLTGVTVVRTEVLEQHPQAVAEFLAAHEASTRAVTANPEAAAQAVVEAGIIDNASIAAKAIPACNIVCVTGEEMKSALSGYLETLFKQDSASVGGMLPDDYFYCTTVALNG